MLHYRPIQPSDDEILASIIRANLEHLHLNIPGTAYFDPELDHLSAFYAENPKKRAYFVVLDDAGHVVGGVGIAEFPGIENCAELQKLYLADCAKGLGCGKALVRLAERWAASAGYENLYLETHTNFAVALQLYTRMGFQPIARPRGVFHETMDHFMLKKLSPAQPV